MHSPTLVLMAAILMGVMALMLMAAWRFNHQTPGLGAWTLAYFSGFLFCASLLLHKLLPESILVPTAHFFLLTMVYMNLVGALAYTGAKPLPKRYALLGAPIVIGVAFYYTAIEANEALRYALSSVAVGCLFLLCARAMLTRPWFDYPARTLYAALCTGHGLFLLGRPWLFALGRDGLFNAAQMIVVSQFVVLESIIAIVLMAFSVVMLASEQVTKVLQHIAEHDSLTGVFNRRSFLAQLEKTAAQMERFQRPLAVLLVDLDHFKTINDSAGHKIGDEALRHFVRIAQTCLRQGDVIGRLGGEEFGIFLPDAGEEEAASVAHRLRSALETQTFKGGKGRIVLTASIGVAQKLLDEAPETSLHRADKAMYEAKKNGRNRVEIATQAEVGEAA